MSFNCQVELFYAVLLCTEFRKVVFFNETVLCNVILKMVEPIFDYQFRLILIGDSTVGKSSLLKYFTDGKFAEVSYGNEK